MIRVAWNADYAHALPEGHRFPMEKYELVPEQLVHEGTLSESQFFRRHRWAMKRCTGCTTRSTGPN